MSHSVKLTFQFFLIGIASILVGLTAQYIGYKEEVIAYLVPLNLIYSFILFGGVHYFAKQPTLIAIIISVMIPALLTLVVCTIDLILQTQTALQLYVAIPLTAGAGLKMYFHFVSKDKD